MKFRRGWILGCLVLAIAGRPIADVRAQGAADSEKVDGERLHAQAQAPPKTPSPATPTAAAPAIPGTAAQAIRSGWKLIEFSTNRANPIVPTLNGQIHSVMTVLDYVYVLQKDAVVIVCNVTLTYDQKWLPAEQKCSSF